MSLHPIHIRVYNSSGAIDASLSPAIILYDNLDNSLDFSGTMTWNATTLNYAFIPNIDDTKTYTATVDFGVSATTRYTTFGVSNVSGGSGGLTTEQATQLTNTVKKGDVILNKGSISIPL